MTPNDRDFDAEILGALLHDIGRFVRRAQNGPSDACHCQIGLRWFQQWMAPKLGHAFNDNQLAIIESAINGHHADETNVSLADCISAGVSSITAEEEAQFDALCGSLLSVFSSVSLSSAPKPRKYHQMVQLGTDSLERIFPIDQTNPNAGQCGALLRAFEAEIEDFHFEKLPSTQIVNAIYHLLWKYLWCVPGAVGHDESDVALFDHLKTTAAVTACLGHFVAETPGQTVDLNTEAFVMIGGDISGIQSYIFDVLTQQGKVAKRLRARSFFVEMVSEIASHRVLAKFCLPQCNVLSSSGGNFYVLAPRLNGLSEAIADLQSQFDRWTIDNLGGELSVSLAYAEIAGTGLRSFSEALETGLKPELARRKLAPHQSALTGSNKWLEDAFLRKEVIQSEETICQGCRKHPSIGAADADDKLCVRCFDDVEMGKILPHRRYIAFFADSSHRFKVLNHSFELLRQEADLAQSGESAYMILALNRSTFEPPVTGFKYITTRIPTRQDIQCEKSENLDEAASFDEIVHAATGDRLLAYLKVDVDRMGEVLQTIASPARFMTFSRMVQTFFGGWVQERVHREFPTLYTVFSGGDDFFAVGPWNEIIRFAVAMRDDFSRFCADNSDLTFSAGIILAKPHDPLSFCAGQASEALNRAKKRDGKNALTLFGETFPWLDVRILLNRAEKVIEWLNAERPVISRGFARNLLVYGDMAQKSNVMASGKDIDTANLKFVPLLAYGIERNLNQSHQKEAYEWATRLLPTTDNPRGGKDLALLRSVMDYVMRYTRS